MILSGTPNKARNNYRKHGVSFEEATTVFRDPKASSICDAKHSEAEDRWITLGLSAIGGVLVVHHTFRDIGRSRAIIRIISSRKATQREIKDYLG